MSSEYWISLVVQLSVYGASIGVIYGTMRTRLNYLEQKLDKHNCLVERMYKAEKDILIIDEKVKTLNHRVDELEEVR